MLVHRILLLLFSIDNKAASLFNFAARIGFHHAAVRSGNAVSVQQQASRWRYVDLTVIYRRNGAVCSIPTFASRRQRCDGSARRLGSFAFTSTLALK